MLAQSIGLITPQQMAHAINKGNLFDIKLDPEEDMGGFLDDTIEEGANDPNDPKDTDDPGANRADSKKSKATQEGGISIQSTQTKKGNT